MSPFEKLVQFSTNFTFSFNWVLKALFLLAMLFYVAFGVVVIRQVSLMSKTLEGTFDLPIKIIAWVHLGMILGLLVIILLAF
ncbi:hypothetical protein AMJ51_02310 [Microgenomates bacterium DG_75]|nr:MAG: hypothetical protein AMJ51_02310 [Microgenomates bacterium DG_75]